MASTQLRLVQENGADLGSRPIAEILRGKTILVTGATGFLAKVFLEKILSQVPNIARIYILIRSVDEAHSIERLENDIFASAIFSQLKEQGSAQFLRFCREKIRLVQGDTSLPRLGLHATQYLELCGQVDLVVHAAASTDFMQRLDEAVPGNALSAFYLTDFIKLSKRARLLHISTCYVNESTLGIVREESIGQPQGTERMVPLKQDGSFDLERAFQDLSQIVESVEQKFSRDSKKLSQQMIKAGYETAQAYGWNNIYTFMKWLGEKILLQETSPIHCTILRPSIIESCLTSPTPGWIEGFKVADPLFYAGGNDFIKFFPGREKTVFDLIPVDFVANAMMLSLAELSQQVSPQTKVYQVCSGVENPIDLKEITRIVRKGFGFGHIKRQFFIPHAVFQPMMWLSFLALKIAGPLFSASQKKNLRKLAAFATLYSPYTSLECTYDNSKLLDLASRVSLEDRNRFPVSSRLIDWEYYLCRVHIPGLIRHIIQPQAEAQMARLSEKLHNRKTGDTR